jgi:hypothetical protein
MEQSSYCWLRYSAGYTTLPKAFYWSDTDVPLVVSWISILLMRGAAAWLIFSPRWSRSPGRLGGALIRPVVPSPWLKRPI